MSSIQRVQEAIQEIKQGKMVIMLDDENRENEGDLVYAATFSSPEKVNFMATHAKGLICVAITNKTAKRLDLSPMVKSNTSSYETAFTVSVDCANAKTGISTKERDDTIKILASPISNANEIVRPGHIFPLIAKDGGVLNRTGHTEGSIDLCKLAGIKEEAVICEIMKDDGTMARRDDLDIFAKKYKMKQIYISDLVEYRLAHESLVTQIEKKTINFFEKKSTKIIYKDHLDNQHTVIVFEEIKKIENVKFHNIQYDLDLFLDYSKIHTMTESIKYLQKHGGVLIFLDQNLESYDAMKDFGIGAQILNKLNIKKINLLTSSKNQHSFIGIHGFGLDINKEIVLN